MTDFIRAAVELRIPFHDVDPASIVWHGNYFKYFEAARVALLDKLDYGYTRMAESGFVWPVVDLSARFSRPITFDQIVRVEACLVEWEYRMKITYEITDPGGNVLGKGMTLQVPLEIDSRELVLGTPRFLSERIEAMMDGAAHSGSEGAPDRHGHESGAGDD